MHLQIDRPAPNSPIPRLVHFAGWLQTSSDRSAYTFFLNGHRQERIQYSERRDVPERESFDTFGWNFICEVSKIATADQGAVTFSIFEHGICIAVYYYTCIALEEQKQQPCLFMMHIPKSAGTSIRHAVEKLYKPQEVFCIYDDPCFAAMEIVSQLSSKAFDNFKIVYGHFSYGVHQHTSREYRYTASMRPPRDYMQSYFYFMKYVQKDPRFETRDIFQGMSEIDIIEFDNCYTRYFSGKLEKVAVNIDDFRLAVANGRLRDLHRTRRRHSATAGALKREQSRTGPHHLMRS